MKAIRALLFSLIPVVGVFAQESLSGTAMSGLRIDTANIAPETVPADTTASMAFVLPADGDVFYSADVKVIVHTQGPLPAGMLAVVDGFSYDRPLHIEDGLITLDLPGLKAGVHDVKIVFLNEKREIELSRSVRFFVRVPEPKHKTLQGKLRQFGRISSRLDWKGADAQGRIVQQSKLNVDTARKLYTGAPNKPLSKNLDGTLEGAYTVKYGLWEGYVKGLVSTDENNFQQATDRVSGRVSFGPWAYLKGGDVYPIYNPLILNGTRIRGGEAGAAVVTGDGETHWAYAKVVSGETKRQIPFYVAEYDTGNGTRLDTIRGTPAQQLTAFRLGAGGGQTFDLGFTLMKASETSGDATYRFLSDSLHGVPPVDNLVTGLDLHVGIWQGRIQFFGQWAGSLYTRNRAAGPLNSDSSGYKLPVNPAAYKDFIVINPSTQGWEYLVHGPNSRVNPLGFLNANSTYETGITSSIPFSGVTSETEIRYSHLGLEYHSEGNPFLGSNPGDGVTLNQRMLVLENRLTFGVEASDFLQDLSVYKQEERAFKGEVRYLPGAYLPAVWVNGGLTSRAPQGGYAYKFSQDFSELNIGSFHQIVAGPGMLHGSLLYGFTRSALDLTSPDTSNPRTSQVTQTHIVNTALQYKFRGSDFSPRLSYTFANNGIQKSTNNLSLGAQDVFLKQKLRVDADIMLGQYPVSLVKNDISLGENFNLSYRIDESQSVRFREKWIAYGSRISVTSGAYYEMFF